MTKPFMQKQKEKCNFCGQMVDYWKHLDSCPVRKELEAKFYRENKFPSTY